MIYKIKTATCITMLFFLAINSANLFAAGEKVRYQVDIKNPGHHLAQITVLLPKVNSDHVDLVMPRWRPGRYEILPLANGVQKFVARGTNGQSLAVQKINLNTWRVQLEKATKVAVSYELYANELGDRTRHIDSTHAYLDAVSSLMYAPKFESFPINLEFSVPRGWDTVSGLKQGSGKNSFVAKNYDELADSPVETGIHERYQFIIDKVKFELVIWGKGNFDGKKIGQDLVKLVKVQKKYWGEFPFKKFIFILHATSGARGATEHANSTVIQRPRWTFQKKKDYLDFLSTASHELVHSWNVKAYRPQGLVPYNYTKENYSPLLWFVEGGTSYLADMFLVQAKLMTQKEFLKRLAKDIDSYQNKPGRNSMSAADASFNQWISLKGDRAINGAVNIYSKGKMLSLWLDLNLIKQTDGAHSIQDIHRQLFQQFPANIKGYSERDMVQILTDAGFKKAQKKWQQYVRHTAALPLTEMLKYVGLNFEYIDDGKTLSASEQKPFSGIKLKKNKTIIAQVLKNSPAWKANLTAGDVLVAINGLRVTYNDFKALLDAMKIDAKVSISYFHNDELLQTSIKLTAIPTGKPSLTINSAMDENQKKLFSKWLGVDVDEALVK